MAKKTKSTQKRVQEIADELAQTAGRLRDVLDEARPASAGDVHSLQAEIAALGARVSALEAAAAPARRAPAAKAATPRRSTSASKVPAARAAAQRASKKRPTA